MIGRPMTMRERVVAALRGEPVDRVPVSLWLHNFATENSAETLAAETVRLARRFDWDFLKPQSRAQCFAEMWGLRYTPSREPATPYTVTHAPLATAAVAWGADGLFYATNMATRELSTVEKCRRFQRPYDLRVLRAVERAPFNLLHVCGADVLFDEFVDYPATAFSWATVPGNPSLTAAHRRTGCAVVGGLPAKPEIASLPPKEIETRGRRAIAEMGGRFLLLGPDCSINPDTPEKVMDAVTAATR